MHQVFTFTFLSPPLECWLHEDRDFTGPGHLCDLSTEHSAWHMVSHSEELKSYSLAILTLFFFLSNVYFNIFLNKQTS